MHGLENHLKTWVETQPFKHYRNQGRRDKRKSLAVIRYADDFVLIHKDDNVVKAAKAETERWLAQTSKLSLKFEKTNIEHTTKGFEFLSWRFIHLNRNGKLRTRIYPSRKALKQISLRVEQVIQRHRASSSYGLIQELKPVLIGMCNYHKYVECNKAFKGLNNIVWRKLRHWVFRHCRKQPNRTKFKEKYFPSGKPRTTNMVGRFTKTTGFLLVRKKETKKNSAQTFYLIPTG